MCKFFSLFTMLLLAHLSILSNNNLIKLAEALHSLAQTMPQKTCSMQPRVDLDWCDECFPKDIRTKYTNHLVEDINKTFVSTQFTKDNPLIYVSVASGGLRQDFHILKRLLSTIRHLHVFIIDLEYPNCSTPQFNQQEIAQKLQRYNELKGFSIIEKHESFFDDNSDFDNSGYNTWQEALSEVDKEILVEYNKLEQELTGAEEQIPLFTGLVQSLMPDDGSVVVTHLSSIEEYIAIAQGNSTLKPHCISLTDPSTGYGQTNFTNQSNIIKINDRFYFAKPYNQPGQLWDTSNNDDAERKQIITLLLPYKDNKTVSIGTIKTMFDEHNIKNELFSSVFLSMQYLIGKTMRPETIYHRLYHANILTEVVVAPQKVPNLKAFLIEDEVTPFLKDQINCDEECVLNRIQ